MERLYPVLNETFEMDFFFKILSNRSNNFIRSLADLVFENLIKQ